MDGLPRTIDCSRSAPIYLRWPATTVGRARRTRRRRHGRTASRRGVTCIPRPHASRLRPDLHACRAAPASQNLLRALTLELEGNLHTGAVCLHLAALEFHVQL